MHLGSIWLNFFKLKIPLYKNILTLGGTIPFHNSDAKENIPENSIPSNILVQDLTVYVPWLSATQCFLSSLFELKLTSFISFGSYWHETVLMALCFFSSLTSNAKFPSHILSHVSQTTRWCSKQSIKPWKFTPWNPTFQPIIYPKMNCPPIANLETTFTLQNWWSFRIRVYKWMNKYLSMFFKVGL